MVERIENLPNGVLGFRHAGDVTAAEYREGLVRPLREAVAGGTELNLYVELDDDFGLDLGAMWRTSAAGHRPALACTDQRTGSATVRAPPAG